MMFVSLDLRAISYQQWASETYVKARIAFEYGNDALAKWYQDEAASCARYSRVILDTQWTRI